MVGKTPLILIVEDDQDLAATVEKYLRRASFRTHIMYDGNAVVAWVRNNMPSVILLDLMLPGKSGLDICREVNQFSDISIIVTTAKVDEKDRLRGFNAGVDDYLCKPYSIRELVARVQVCLRRHQELDVEEDLVRLDRSRLMVALNKKAVELTAIEFNLFELLYSRPHRIFSRKDIIAGIYEDFRTVSNQTINSHIRNLRNKLLRISPDNDLIQAIYSVGYRYEPVVSNT